uniref:Uncharacterized protein n=1 Tax=Oryza punctata TaxID=4537 RepID=A0A1V1H742_ORYPU|nr:hypothetical protein [Oryza punctata]
MIIYSELSRRRIRSIPKMPHQCRPPGTRSRPPCRPRQGLHRPLQASGLPHDKRTCDDRSGPQTSTATPALVLPPAAAPAHVP